MHADLSGPLHKMLQVGKFDVRKGSKKKLAWTTEAEGAFDKLKERLLGQLGFFLVDPDKGFVLRTEASDYAMGTVLEQVRCDRTHVCWRFGVESWRKANVRRERGSKRLMPLCARSGNGRATSLSECLLFFRFCSICADVGDPGMSHPKSCPQTLISESSRSQLPEAHGLRYSAQLCLQNLQSSMLLQTAFLMTTNSVLQQLHTQLTLQQLFTDLSNFPKPLLRNAATSSTPSPPGTPATCFQAIAETVHLPVQEPASPSRVPPTTTGKLKTPPVLSRYQRCDKPLLPPFEDEPVPAPVASKPNLPATKHHESTSADDSGLTEVTKRKKQRCQYHSPSFSSPNQFEVLRSKTASSFNATGNSARRTSTKAPSLPQKAEHTRNFNQYANVKNQRQKVHKTPQERYPILPFQNFTRCPCPPISSSPTRVTCTGSSSKANGLAAEDSTVRRQPCVHRSFHLYATCIVAQDRVVQIYKVERTFCSVFSTVFLLCLSCCLLLV